MRGLNVLSTRFGIPPFRSCSDAGVPKAVVMALVGHENAAMSHRYTHVGKEALSRAAQTLPEI